LAKDLTRRALRHGLSQGFPVRWPP
jgi:hypothetical protein